MQSASTWTLTPGSIYKMPDLGCYSIHISYSAGGAVHLGGELKLADEAQKSMESKHV